MRPRIGVVLGSVREGRKGELVAHWVLDHAAGRAADYALVDLADRPLPHYAEPLPPMLGRYRDPATREWAAVVAGFDAFVIVTAEYNHGVPSALKNAIDHVYAEWNDKAVGFVGYGLVGGARAIDQLRVLAGTLGMADVRPQVHLQLFTDITEDGVVADDRTTAGLLDLFDAVEAWNTALTPLRGVAS